MSIEELQAKIALKRRQRAETGQTVTNEHYPREACPLCHEIYSKLPFEGHCYDCEQKIMTQRQRPYIQLNNKREVNYKKRKIKKVEEWQDRLSKKKNLWK